MLQVGSRSCKVRFGICIVSSGRLIASPCYWATRGGLFIVCRNACSLSATTECIALPPAAIVSPWKGQNCFVHAKCGWFLLTETGIAGFVN